jgi:TolB-like protein
VLHRVLNEEPVKPTKLRPELPVEFERLVLRLLEKEPGDRVPSAAALAHELGTIRPETLAPRPAPAPSSGSGDTPLAGVRRWWHRVMRRRFGPAQVAGLLLATALVITAVWFAARKGWIPGFARRQEVVAVIPFDNTSPDPEQFAYLAEGLGDELVVRLSEGLDYRVLPWQTSRGARTASRSVREVARDLGADAVVVGSFRGDEERLRVTASLVDGRSGVVRWSRTFDQPVRDLMTVQAEIATSVASTIEGALAPAEARALAARPSESPEAYTYYLQGAAYLGATDLATWALARPHFEKAIELDPRLAEAYVGRGATLVDEVFRGVGGLASLRAARADFAWALELRPQMVRAQRGLVSVAYEAGHSEEMLRIAARLAKRGDSDIEGLLTRGWACTFSGLSGEALPLFRRVLELDPAHREASWFLTFSSQWAGRPRETLAEGRKHTR